MGITDVASLDEYLSVAYEFGISNEELLQDIRDMGSDASNIDNWFYVAIDRSFLAIMDQLEDNVEYYVEDDEEEEKVLEEIESMRESFTPCIDGCCSGYNNILDTIGFIQSQEDILKEVY